MFCNHFKNNMTKGTFLLLTLMLTASTAIYLGSVPSKKCLTAICKVESGCNPIGCRMDAGSLSLSCGYYQITEQYYFECNRQGKGWKSCAKNLKCASQCVRHYVNRHSRHCQGTCECFARIHHGGPNGYHHSSTHGYWKKVKQQLQDD